VPGPSGTAIILVTSEAATSIIGVPEANASLHPEDLERNEASFRDASIVLCQLETPLRTVEELGRITQRFHIPFILDPAPALALSPSLLRTITWLTPNESECRILLHSLGHLPPATEGDFPPEEAAQRLLDAGVRNVILKVGSRGFYIAGRDVEPTYVSSFQVQAVDTTAAGDAFNGGFAYALTHGGLDPLPLSAARFANAVAAVSFTRAGAQSSMPRLAEVQALLEAAS
jgi:ribokinase